jgi:hypothetical protein
MLCGLGVSDMLSDPVNCWELNLHPPLYLFGIHIGRLNGLGERCENVSGVEGLSSLNGKGKKYEAYGLELVRDLKFTNRSDSELRYPTVGSSSETNESLTGW